MIVATENTEATTDPEWGCEHHIVDSGDTEDKIRLFHVNVADLEKISISLTAAVQNNSWMMNFDTGLRRSYQKTVEETAKALSNIFENVTANESIKSEFGELMVSLGSARTLEILLKHARIPLAELWKPQVKQNEGFDFHTVCEGNFINFGEAKYSSGASPHGLAITQAVGFIEAEKHLRDRIHLINLTSAQAIKNLDDDAFGVVAAFSINAADKATVLKNAYKTAKEAFSSENIKFVYLIGVTC